MRVLVVEDEPTVRRHIADVLRGAGYIAAEAENGLVALKSMRRELPDVVLLDLRMPVMDGFAFNDERRKDPVLSTVPIILISGDNRESYTRLFGAFALVGKPIDEVVLLAELKRVVEATNRARD